jgi:hypothetical protein
VELENTTFKGSPRNTNDIECRILGVAGSSPVLSTIIMICKAAAFRPMQPDERFTGGKYCGQTLRDVASVSPQYIEWAIKNVKGFHISSSARDLVDRTKKLQFESWKMKQSKSTTPADKTVSQCVSELRKNPLICASVTPKRHLAIATHLNLI